MSLRRKTFLILALLLLLIIGMLVLLTYRFFHEQSQYRLFLIILFMMGVLIAAIVYFIVDYLTISRIEKLTCALEHITSSHNLSERLQVDHSRDEISLLETCVNSMLEEMQDSEKRLLQDQTRLEKMVDERTAALQESEAKFRLLVENQTEMLIKLDSEDRVVFVSPSFCELFGVKADYVLYQPLLKSIRSEVRETTRQAIQALHQPPYEGYVELHLMTDKGRRWLGWLGKALRDECGGVTGIILTARDITGQKENEIALADTQESYRSTLDSLGDMVQVVDEDLRILLCNEVFRDRMRQLGQDGNLIRRKLFEVQDFLSEEVEKEYQKVFSSGEMLITEGRTSIGDQYYFTETRKIPVFAGGRVSRVVTVIRDVTESRHLELRTKQLLEQQVVFNKLSLALSSIYNDLDSIYRTLYRYISSMTDADVFIVSEFDRGKQEIRPRFAIMKGIAVNVADFPPVALESEGMGTQSRVIRSGEPLNIPDSILYYKNMATLLYNFEEGKVGTGELPMETEEQARSMLLVPMKMDGVVVGVMQVQSFRPGAYGQEDAALLTGLANVAAVSIRNAELIKDQEFLNLELVRSYDSTLEGWARALELRDKETHGHSDRVTDLTLLLASAMGMMPEQLVHVRRGALLHDIGKMGIPDHVLLKSGKLDEGEWKIMRQHPIYAAQMLEGIDYLKPALDIPLYHHEWWDGSGYPYGLKGEEIPMAARVFSIIDVWDALRSERSYRKAWPNENTRTYLTSLSGKQFDPRVVDTFFNIVLKVAEAFKL